MDSLNSELRGKAISENQVKDHTGEVHSAQIPKEMIGKNVVVRGDKVTERIDS